MEIESVNISNNGGSVFVIVKVIKSPVNIAGVLWRYKNDQSNEGKAGIFTSNISEVPLGVPNNIDGKYFLAEGAILHNNYTPPFAYQVVMTITQGGQKIYEKVPETGGSGQVAKADVPFFHSFQIIVV